MCSLSPLQSPTHSRNTRSTTYFPGSEPPPAPPFQPTLPQAQTQPPPLTRTEELAHLRANLGFRTRALRTPLSTFYTTLSSALTTKRATLSELLIPGSTTPVPEPDNLSSEERALKLTLEATEEARAAAAAAEAQDELNDFFDSGDEEECWTKVLADYTRAAEEPEMRGRYVPPPTLPTVAFLRSLPAGAREKTIAVVLEGMGTAAGVAREAAGLFCGWVAEDAEGWGGMTQVRIEAFLSTRLEGRDALKAVLLVLAQGVVGLGQGVVGAGSLVGGLVGVGVGVDEAVEREGEEAELTLEDYEYEVSRARF